MHRLVRRQAKPVDEMAALSRTSSRRLHLCGQKGLVSMARAARRLPLEDAEGEGQGLSAHVSCQFRRFDHLCPVQVFLSVRIFSKMMSDILDVAAGGRGWSSCRAWIGL